MDYARVQLVFPDADMRWIHQIAMQSSAHGIDTWNEQASFLAQFGHETLGFTRFEENLNYSAKRLMRVWPRRFPDILTAQQYEHNPEALAEKVYGGRMGNTERGDGWRYRGRGPQLTGKRNYRIMGALTSYALLTDPDLMLDPVVGVKVACIGWKELGLDWQDDDADARAETNAINGGEIGLHERQMLLDRLLA